MRLDDTPIDITNTDIIEMYEHKTVFFQDTGEEIETNLSDEERRIVIDRVFDKIFFPDKDISKDSETRTVREEFVGVIDPRDSNYTLNGALSLCPVVPGSVRLTIPDILNSGDVNHGLQTIEAFDEQKEGSDHYSGEFDHPLLGLPQDNSVSPFVMAPNEIDYSTGEIRVSIREDAELRQHRTKVRADYTYRSFYLKSENGKRLDVRNQNMEMMETLNNSQRVDELETKVDRLSERVQSLTHKLGVISDGAESEISYQHA